MRIGAMAHGEAATSLEAAGAVPGVHRSLAAGALLLLALTLSGCGTSGPAPVYDGYGPAPAGYYRIRNGDTLLRIARRHEVNYKVLARWNKLGPPYRIYAGSLLRVQPFGSGRKSRTTSRSGRTASAKSRSAGKPKAVATRSATSKTQGGHSKVRSTLKWRWPLQGKVVQGYRRGDRTRQGIRIAGRGGQKVRAAEGGSVVYSGSGLKGYGNLIIVKHDEGYLSAYGFNRRLLVGEGARVTRGENVAEIGQASDGEYLLHFEIRKNGTTVDPLRYLP